MNSRERVLKSMNFKVPDHIPWDLGGHRSSGISALAYKRLKEALGISSGEVYVYDIIQQLAIVEPAVLEYFNIDTIEMGRAFCLNEADWKSWELPDGSPCKIPSFINVDKTGETWTLRNKKGVELGIQKKGCLYFEQTSYPMKDRDFEHDPFDDLEDQFKKAMWTAIASPGSHLELQGKDLLQLKEGAQEFRTRTQKAIIGLFGGNLFETPQFLFGNENYLQYLALYPDAVHRLSGKLTELYCNNIEKWLGAVGPYIDIMLFGDDLGSNQGPIIDPEMYREYYKPYHKKMWLLVKKIAPHVKILLHSCGGIEPYLDDLIDAGLDAVNPVQISSKGMDLEFLKNKYGGRITLWGGGCDTQHILPHGTPDMIEEHVKHQMNLWKETGGFVFQQVHNITADVPTCNIIALLESVNKFR